MAPITRNFVAAIEACADANGIDLIRFEKGGRKDERTQAYLQQWHGGEGVLYIGKAQEKARVLRTQTQVDPATGSRTPSLAFSTALPNAYYFYAVDEDFGPFRLPHPFSPQNRLAGLRYDVSMLQAEFSVTQVFDRPLQGRMFFEEVIRENLDLGRPDHVQLAFERRVSKRTPSRFRTRVITAGVDPALHFDYKNTRIKQYFKEGRALRTETTINDCYDFGVGRRPGNLEHLKEIGFQANRRLLCIERLNHDCTMGAERFEQFHQSAEIAGQRAPSLRLGDRRVQALLGALAAFRLLPRGFTHRQLRERVAPLLGTTPEEWGPGRMTYDLRRLRLRGLIERIPRTRRYRVTDEGFRTALCFHRTYARVLRPSLSVVFDSAVADPTPLQKAVQRFDREIDRLWEGQTIAA